MGFAWDVAKAASNLVKHGVSFVQARTVFLDAGSASFFDAAHSYEEDRYVTIGMDSEARLLYVVHTDDGVDIRLISAREASSHERKQYERNR